MVPNAIALDTNQHRVRARCWIASLFVCYYNLFGMKQGLLVAPCQRLYFGTLSGGHDPQAWEPLSRPVLIFFFYR